MTIPLFILSLIVGLMLAEARVSAAHRRALLTAGAIEPVEPLYRVMALAYPSCFVAMTCEGIWRAAGPSPLFASGAVLFMGAKLLKYWAIGSLGERWTFRVLVLPNVPLVSTGPYRYIAHPNYVAVLGELVATAMMMEAFITGPVALVVFGFVLLRRIQFEEEAIRWPIR